MRYREGALIRAIRPYSRAADRDFRFGSLPTAHQALRPNSRAFHPLRGRAGDWAADLTTRLVRDRSSPDTTAALIEAGGTSGQPTLYATLSELPVAAAGWSHGGPTLLLVGDCALQARIRRGLQDSARQAA